LLDLSTPARSAVATSASAPEAPLASSTAPAPPARTARARAIPSPAVGDLALGFPPERVFAGAPVVLTRVNPAVVLTAVQSGVGALTVHAACSDSVGDLRLACAYQLRSGQSSVASHARGLRTAPMDSRRPLILSGRNQYESITIDLRQVLDLQRLVVLAFSESGAPLRWGGALIVETVGGSRVDVPLDRDPAAGVLVALSVSNVGGQLVLRDEHELVAGTLRDACLAYGFERITWVDPFTPLT
jgi:hypothetical protein